jgi:protein TonB
MNDFELDQMLAGVISEGVNVPVPEGLAARVKASSFASSKAGNVLTFGMLDQVGGTTQTRRTAVGAAMLHAAVLALLFVQIRAMHDRIMAPASMEGEVILSAPPPPLAASDPPAGGGGGHASAAPVSRGTPPPTAPVQVVPLDAARVQDARLAEEPAIVAQAIQQMAASPMPELGMPNAAAVGASPGDGRGAGIGAGDGSGAGPGFGSNFGGLVRRIGGSVSAPVVLFAPQAEFSEEARKAKVSGNVLVDFQVDEQGHPTHVRVLRGIGLGLDEKAVESVRQYRFKPAMENGKPVVVEMQVEVNFQIF